MTTTIRITLPIELGAKTCEGCDRYNNHDHCGDWCEPFKRRLPISGVRLHECLAAERRELSSECWYVRYPDGCRSTPFARRQDAAYYRDTYCTGHLSGSKLVHVRRYRKEARQWLTATY